MKIKIVRKLLSLFIGCTLAVSISVTALDLIRPITVNADQNIYSYLNKNSQEPLLSWQLQQQYYQRFLQQFFYPWQTKIDTNNWIFNARKVNLHNYIKEQITFYQQHLGYDVNFHKHAKIWLNRIINNVNLAVFPNTNNKAIVIFNTHARVMPTLEPHYFYFKIAGEGYPFDNFEKSIVYAGTPVRVLQVSNDHAWVFMFSGTEYGWVQARDIAYVNKDFIRKWQTGNYVTFNQDKISLLDQHKVFRFIGYIGTVLPQSGHDLLVPVANLEQQAVIVKSKVDKKLIRMIPAPLTQRNMAFFIKRLLNIPYGWGGIYYDNDCSGTLRALFTPFGMFMPASADDFMYVGKRVVDISKMSMLSRENYILKHAEPFITLIHLQDHIMLYIGNKAGRVMTFQNIWGLHTKDKTGAKGRDVIGQSVIMPIAFGSRSKVEAPEIAKKIMQIIFLDS